MQCISSQEKLNIDVAWNSICTIWDRRQENGMLSATKKAQSLKHFHSYFEYELIERSKQMLGLGKATALEDEVVRGKMSPREAAELAISQVLKE